MLSHACSAFSEEVEQRTGKRFPATHQDRIANVGIDGELNTFSRQGGSTVLNGLPDQERCGVPRGRALAPRVKRGHILNQPFQPFQLLVALPAKRARAVSESSGWARLAL